MSRYGRVGSPLQCVPFARANSGIQLTGNAANWWENAAGVYERGSRPEVGSVLNFRSISRMRLGHVAVVSRVIDSRHVEIDHANWAYPGGVSRAIDVIDVSPRNDWTAVRVELARGNEFGAIYPTYGFIYDRPDHGTLVANTLVASTDATPAPVLNPPANDYRTTNARAATSVGREAEEEVAEAGDETQPQARHAAYNRASFGKAGAMMRRVAAPAQPTAKVLRYRRGHPTT